MNKYFLLALASGAAAGAITAFILTSNRLSDLSRSLRMLESGHGGAQIAPGEVSTSTFPTISLVPIERRVASPLLPPAFLKRRLSATAAVYRRIKGGQALDERLLGPERLLGHAVALTADGWFVTSAFLFEGLRVSDIVLWSNGAAYTVERGVRDNLNHTVYLKIQAQGMTSPAFAHAGDITTGLGVWIESRIDGFAPRVVVDVSARAWPNDAASSEVAARRILLDGVTPTGGQGSAVWDSGGTLIGIVDSKEGEELRFVPATTLAASFASLLDKGEIRHASLGLRTVDLARLRLEGARGGLPERGALIRADKKSGRPGIQRDSPVLLVLKSGDVILRIERDTLDGTADLGELLADYRPGTSVTLRIWRDQRDLDVKVTLGSVVTSEELKKR